jgi:hypothetical protein
MGKVFITCKEATNFISQKEEGKLPLKKRIDLWIHLAICSMCKLFAKQNKTIINNINGLEENLDASLSDHEKQAMIDRLETAS